MPFKSKAQQRACYAKKSNGEAGSWDCDEFSSDTDFDRLPEKVGGWAELLNTIKGGAKAHPVATGLAVGLPAAAVGGPVAYNTYKSMTAPKPEVEAPTPSISDKFANLTTGQKALMATLGVGALGVGGYGIYRAIKSRKDRREKHKQGSDQMTKIAQLAIIAAYKQATDGMDKEAKLKLLSKLLGGGGNALKSFGQAASRGLKGGTAAPTVSGSSMTLKPQMMERLGHLAGRAGKIPGQVGSIPGQMAKTVGQNLGKTTAGAGAGAGIYAATQYAQPASEIYQGTQAPVKDKTVTPGQGVARKTVQQP